MSISLYSYTVICLYIYIFCEYFLSYDIFRIDAIISLPLPDAEQRAAFIALRSLHLLSDFIDQKDKDKVLTYLPMRLMDGRDKVFNNGNANKEESSNHNNQSKNNNQKNEKSNYDKKCDRDSSLLRSSDSTYDAYKTKLEKLKNLSYAENDSSYQKTSQFEIEYCLLKTVILSENWSLRYLEKIMSNIRSEVLGTERYMNLKASLYF